MVQLHDQNGISPRQLYGSNDCAVISMMNLEARLINANPVEIVSAVDGLARRHDILEELLMTTERGRFFSKLQEIRLVWCFRTCKTG